MVTVKLDYDYLGIYAIARIHRAVVGLVKDMGWWVDGIQVWRSASGRGRHVEMEVHAIIEVWPESAQVCWWQQVLRSDARRGIWEVSRLLSDNDDWEHQDNWDLLWEEKRGRPHKVDVKGADRLRKVWTRV